MSGTFLRRLYLHCFAPEILSSVGTGAAERQETSCAGILRPKPSDMLVDRGRTRHPPRRVEKAPKPRFEPRLGAICSSVMWGARGARSKGCDLWDYLTGGPWASGG